MNGIIIDDKVYEAVENGTCDKCDFDNDVKICRCCCDICEMLNCAFRFSQHLTDKLNCNTTKNNDSTT